jgi:hypothetical protein
MLKYHNLLLLLQLRLKATKQGSETSTPKLLFAKKAINRATENSLRGGTARAVR